MIKKTLVTALVVGTLYSTSSGASVIPKEFDTLSAMNSDYILKKSVRQNPDDLGDVVNFNLFGDITSFYISRADIGLRNDIITDMIKFEFERIRKEKCDNKPISECGLDIQLRNLTATIPAYTFYDDETFRGLIRTYVVKTLGSASGSWVEIIVNKKKD